MNSISNLLNTRKAHLLKLIQEKKTALSNSPQGTLRLCKHGEKIYYYHRTDAKDTTGKYLRKKDLNIAKALAQKDYDQKILQSCIKELDAIQKYQEYCPEYTIDDIYETLHKERQKLVIPLSDTDKQYIEKWTSISYQGKDFAENTPEFYTAKGERVRSKSEVIIADLLNRENIPYKYECPLLIDGHRLIYPDFTLLHTKQRKQIYLEHLGMMDNVDYVEKALKKIDSYERNNIYPGESLILTYETFLNPLNQKNLLNKIRHYFQ